MGGFMMGEFMTPDFMWTRRKRKVKLTKSAQTEERIACWDAPIKAEDQKSIWKFQ